MESTRPARSPRWLRVAGLLALSSAGCDSARQADVEMLIERAGCVRAACADRVSGTGVFFADDGSDVARTDGARTLYVETRTSSNTTMLLEASFVGRRIDGVELREIRRSQVIYRGRIVRRDFASTGTGWTFSLDTVADRTSSPDGSSSIRIRNGRIRLRGTPNEAMVSNANQATEIEGGCGGGVGIYLPDEPVAPDPLDPDIEDPFEPDPDDPVSPDDPGSPDDPFGPDPASDEPPPPPEDGDFGDGGGCSGDTIEGDDSGGGCAGDDPSEEESTGCGGDESADETESTGCAGDDTSDDEQSTGCASADDEEATDADDDGCTGDEPTASASSIFTYRAARGTFRLAWPVGLVAWVNRRMRRRCGRADESV